MRHITCHLDAHLKSRGLTRGEFAKQAGLRPAVVDAYCENRRTRLNLKHLDAMCRTLGCQPGDLFAIADE